MKVFLPLVCLFATVYAVSGLKLGPKDIEYDDTYNFQYLESDNFPAYLASLGLESGDILGIVSNPPEINLSISGLNRRLIIIHNEDQTIQYYTYQLGDHLLANFFGAGEVDYLMSAGFNGEVIAQDTGESSHVILSEFLTGQLKFTYSHGNVVATVTFQLV